MKIAAYRLPELQAKLDTFNRKAAKWNLPLVSFEIVSRWVKEIKNEITHEVEGCIEYAEVTITGEIPKVAGWAVHSRVEPTPTEGQNFVYTAPQFAPAESLRSTPMICQHCNTSRRRSLVYLLQNEATGEQKLVGKSCVADFLPATNIEQLLAYMEYLRTASASEEEDERSPGARQAYVYPVDLAIAEALVLIRRDGYVSRKAANEWNDRQDVDGGNFKYPTSGGLGVTGKHREEHYSQEELAAVGPMVEAVKSFILGMNAEGNDFAYNLQLAVSQQYAKPRLFGYIAAGVQQYLKSLETAQERATRANEHMGTIGKREVFHGLKLVRENAVQGAYGTTYILGLEDEAGNSFVWFASKPLGDIGDVFSLKATVKAHDEYKGRKQTVISRAAVEAVVKAAT